MIKRKQLVIGLILVSMIALGVFVGTMSLANTSDEKDQNTLPDGQEWVLTGFADEDEPRVPVDGTEITITFSIDDTTSSIGFSGSAGCNHYFGSFEITGDGLAIGPIGATEMWCGDEKVMEQEHEFLQALGTIYGYQINGNNLEMPYDGGVLIFTKG